MLLPAYKEEEESALMLDLMAFLVSLAVTAYTAHFVHKNLRYTKVASLARAIVIFLVITLSDGIRYIIELTLSIDVGEKVGNVIWCLYITGMALIVWETYNYLKSQN
jgi:hypothetical protein